MTAEDQAKLDGWNEAMRLVAEIAQSTEATEETAIPVEEAMSRYNEVSALLSTRVGTGKEITMLVLILMGLDGWRKEHV